MFKLILAGVPLLLALCLMKRAAYKSWFGFWRVLFALLMALLLAGVVDARLESVEMIQSYKWALIAAVLPFILWLIQALLCKFLTPVKSLEPSNKALDRTFSFLFNYGTAFFVVGWIFVVIALTPWRSRILGEKLSEDAVDHVFAARGFFQNKLMRFFCGKTDEIPVEIPAEAKPDATQAKADSDAPPAETRHAKKPKRSRPSKGDSFE